MEAKLSRNFPGNRVFPGTQRNFRFLRCKSGKLAVILFAMVFERRASIPETPPRVKRNEKLRRERKLESLHRRLSKLHVKRVKKVKRSDEPVQILFSRSEARVLRG